MGYLMAIWYMKAWLSISYDMYCIVCKKFHIILVYRKCS